jgi:transcriptional regulator with XRE-family HTH domain
MVGAAQADRREVALLIAEIGSEKYAVERIRAELAERGWSQAELSRRMEEAVQEGRNGGVIHQGVLSKLLAGDRGRHIRIDQLLTLARVFGVPMGELLLPPGELANVRGWRHYREVVDLQNRIRRLTTTKWELLADIRRRLNRAQACGSGSGKSPRRRARGTVPRWPR